MADRVQFILDKMAPTIKEMEKLEIFSKDEISSIIKQRTDFEYTLRRRQLVPSDYFKYLKFELNLEELRSMRSSKLLQECEKEVQHRFRQISSKCMTHISNVFERGLRRFPNNMEMWSDYIAFLKDKGSFNTLNIVFGQALHLHPTNEDLWLQASMFELGTNSNAHAARVLLQRAIRLNPKSQKLWMRYFELELWYSLRNTERRNFLGLDNNNNDNNNDNNDNNDPTLGIPWIVYQHAVSSITTSSSISISTETTLLNHEIKQHLQFCFSFLKSCENLSPSLHRKIFLDIQQRFDKTIEYWENIFYQYVNETAIPTYQGLLSFKEEDQTEEVDENNYNLNSNIENNIDSVSIYLENCYQILNDYSINMNNDSQNLNNNDDKNNNSNKKNKKSKNKSNQNLNNNNNNHNKYNNNNKNNPNYYVLYGKILTLAFQRVMKHLSNHTYELLIDSVPVVEASTKKRKKEKTLKQDENSKDSVNDNDKIIQRSIQRLSKIFEKFRVSLISLKDSLSSNLTLKSESEILISQHELYRLISYLSNVTNQTYDTSNLPNVISLCNWIKEHILCNLTSYDPSYRNLCVITSNLIQIIWKSSFSSFSSLSIISYEKPNELSNNQKYIDIISNLQSVTKFIHDNIDIILVSEDTISKDISNQITYSINSESNLLTHFGFFLENPPFKLREYILNNDNDSDSDNDSSDDDDNDNNNNNNQKKNKNKKSNNLFVNFIKSIVSSQTCLSKTRIFWSIRYIRYVSFQNIESFRLTVNWIESAYNQIPQSITGVDFTEYYNQVVNVELSYLQILIKQKDYQSSNNSKEFQHIERFLDCAINRCHNSVVKFQNVFAEVQRMKGDHKHANHLIWRNKFAG